MINEEVHVFIQSERNEQFEESGYFFPITVLSGDEVKVCRDSLERFEASQEVHSNPPSGTRLTCCSSGSTT